MSSLLPIKFPVSIGEGAEPQLVEIDDEAADEVFDALSSATARSLLGSLYEEPATASELAAGQDSSLQNVRYHLDKLMAAGLVEVADTWYSDRGREMKVYAPANSSVVVVGGRGSPASTLRSVLEQLVGGVGVLAIASLVVDRLARTAGPGGPSPDEAGAPVETEVARATATGTPGPSPTPMATPTPVPEATPAATPAPTPVAAPGGPDLVSVLLSPGVSFFIGGLFVLLLAVAWANR